MCMLINRGISKMTNHSYTCPVGVKAIITVKGLSTTIKIGRQRGRCNITVEGEAEKEVEGEAEEEGEDEEETIKAEFKITFYFPKKGFDPEKCFIKGNASFVGKATVKKIGEEPYDIPLNEEIDFDTSEGKDGEPYCEDKEFIKKHKVTFNNYAHPILLAPNINIRKIIIEGELTVNVSCFQKKKGKYLKNKRTGEHHDLENTKGSCNIDRMNEANKEYLSSIEEGCNGCYHCLREYDTG